MTKCSISIALALVAGLAGCKKKDEAPAASKDPAPPAGTGTAAPPAGTAAPSEPAPPPGEPAAFQVMCGKLFPKELAAKTHGADGVTVHSEGEGDAHCEPTKGGSGVGNLSIDCSEGFDTEAAMAFKVEREAMTKARELTPMIGRDGYRLGDTAFIILDDDTPCRLHVSWLEAPAEAVYTEGLKAIMASVTPAALK